MQNQKISELYTDDNKSKHSRKNKKNFYEKLYTKETTSKTATTEFISKIPNRKEISNEKFHLCEARSLYMRP